MPTITVDKVNTKPSTIVDYEDTESNDVDELDTLAEDFLKEFKKNINFLPNAWGSTNLNEIQNIIDNPPRYIYDQSNGNYFHKTGTRKCNCRVKRFFGFRVKWFCRTCNVGFQKYWWKYTLNSNFFNEIKEKKNFLINTKKLMEQYMFNYCSNPNTLLNEEGIKNCNYESTLLKYYALASNTKNLSQETMDLIKNNDSYPQYKLANSVNNELANLSNWNVMTERNNLYPKYSKYQFQQLKNYIQKNENVLNESYNDCNSNTSLTSVDVKGFPVASCVNTVYTDAINKCSQAYEMSQTYKYGTDKLMGLWTDVSNSVPGNTIGANKTILSNASGSCAKWINMFNQWEEAEEKALAEPCIKERPITSLNDETVKKIAQEWNNTANDHINKLNDKLESIKSKMINYPNILVLKKENIINGPPGMTPTANIKNYKTDFGNIPTQYLEMILPNGQQGDEGPKGTNGMKGPNGKNGIRGKTGPIGNPTIPF